MNKNIARLPQNPKGWVEFGVTNVRFDNLVMKIACYGLTERTSDSFGVNCVECRVLRRYVYLVVYVYTYRYLLNFIKHVLLHNTDICSYKTFYQWTFIYSMLIHLLSRTGSSIIGKEREHKILSNSDTADVTFYIDFA